VGIHLGQGTAPRRSLRACSAATADRAQTNLAWSTPDCRGRRLRLVRGGAVTATPTKRDVTVGWPMLRPARDQSMFHPYSESAASTSATLGRWVAAGASKVPVVGRGSGEKDPARPAASLLATLQAASS